MAFGAVLDADVLIRIAVCDTLLRLGELELFDPRWSDLILNEVRSNLEAELGIAPDLAARRVQAMEEAFEDAGVPAEPIDRLVPAMTNHPKDRHVLAAAVASGAQVVVTFNLRDFPPEACEAHGVEAQHPDEFLVHLFDLAPLAVRRAVEEQASDLQSPPMTTDELLDILKKVVPRFAAAVRATV